MEGVSPQVLRLFKGVAETVCQAMAGQGGALVYQVVGFIVVAIGQRRDRVFPSMALLCRQMIEVRRAHGPLDLLAAECVGGLPSEGKAFFGPSSRVRNF